MAIAAAVVAACLPPFNHLRTKAQECALTSGASTSAKHSIRSRVWGRECHWIHSICSARFLLINKFISINKRSQSIENDEPVACFSLHHAFSVGWTRRCHTIRMYTQKRFASMAYSLSRTLCLIAWMRWSVAGGRWLFAMQDAYSHLSPLHNCTILGRRRPMAYVFTVHRVICAQHTYVTYASAECTMSTVSAPNSCRSTWQLCWVSHCVLTRTNALQQPGELPAATAHIHNEDRHWSTSPEPQKQLLVNECVCNQCFFACSCRHWSDIMLFGIEWRARERDS